MDFFLRFALSTFLIAPVFAPEPTTVAGRVVDETGGVLVGADVRLEGDLIGAPRTTVTDERGRFRFEGVPAGPYRLTVRAPGFGPKTRTANPGDRGLVEISVEPSGLSEEITVAATATRNEVDRVPGEVNVIERESFDRVQARSLDDVLRYEPGVNMDGARARPRGGGHGHRGGAVDKYF